METESEFIEHTNCDACGSSDANAKYTDGHTHCFSCGAYDHGDGTKEERGNDALEPGEYSPLKVRALRAETLRKFDYRLSPEKSAHFATYYDSQGKAVAQKKRTADKGFMWIGDPKKAGLFGQQCWAAGGKMLVVTEGEIDAMSMSQVQSNRWPVVSIKNGASGATECVRKSIEYLSSFDKIIFMFDHDEPGVDAAIECAALLPPGKAFIAQLPLKDANAMLVAQREQELISAMWQAKPYRPDGIVTGDDLWEILQTHDPVREANYPYQTLDTMLHGLRKGEVVTFVAGTGVGKSTICKEVAFDLINQGKKVGMVALEESVKFTAKSLMSLELNQPLHLTPMDVDCPEYHAAFEKTAAKVAFYDHWGSTDSAVLLSKVRFMAVGLGCEYVILDHISIMVSGTESRDSERVLLDKAMTRLASLCREVNIGLIIVCHLKKSDGKPFEEGAKVTLGDVRGTAGVGQMSNIVVAAERDQQSGNSKVTLLRVLKNRFSGTTGEAGQLQWHEKTGRLLDYDPFEETADETESTTTSKQTPEF